MRSLIVTAFAAALVAFGANPVSAQMEMAETTEVELEATVVDLSCKIALNASGESHRECAQVCADAGIPLGLMTDDGKFYLPISQAMAQNGYEVLKPHAEHRVSVKGRVIERAGMNAIIVDEVTML